MAGAAHSMLKANMGQANQSMVQVSGGRQQPSGGGQSGVARGTKSIGGRVGLGSPFKKIQNPYEVTSGRNENSTSPSTLRFHHRA